LTFSIIKASEANIIYMAGWKALGTRRNVLILNVAAALMVVLVASISFSQAYSVGDVLSPGEFGFTGMASGWSWPSDSSKVVFQLLNYVTQHNLLEIVNDKKFDSWWKNFKKDLVKRIEEEQDFTACDDIKMINAHFALAAFGYYENGQYRATGYFHELCDELEKLLDDFCDDDFRDDDFDDLPDDPFVEVEPQIIPMTTSPVFTVEPALNSIDPDIGPIIDTFHVRGFYNPSYHTNPIDPMNPTYVPEPTPKPWWVPIVVIGGAGLVFTGGCVVVLVAAPAVTAAGGGASVISLAAASKVAGGAAAAATIVGGVLVLENDADAAAFTAQMDEIASGNLPQIYSTCSEMGGFPLTGTPTLNLGGGSLTGNCKLSDILTDTTITNYGYDSKGNFYVVMDYESLNYILPQSIKSLNTDVLFRTAKNGDLSSDVFIFNLFENLDHCKQGTRLKANYPYCYQSPYELIDLKCDDVTGFPAITITTGYSEGGMPSGEDAEGGVGPGTGDQTQSFCNNNPDTANCPAYNDACDVNKNEKCVAKGNECKCEVQQPPPEPPEPEDSDTL